MTKVYFGRNSTLSLPAGIEVAGCRDPDAGRDLSLGAAVQQALRDPLDYPRLADVIFEGDRIAIALEDGLVQMSGIVAALVQGLMEAGARPENMVVVRSKRDARRSPTLPTRLLDDAIRDRIEVVVHDPRDRQSLSYLATSQHEQPIYFNREICDADVVFPVGVLRPTESLGYLGVNGTVFPTFADLEAQRRFQAPQSSLSAAERELRRREADEAAWLLGIRWTVQVIPGRGNAVVRVLAGDSPSVAAAGDELCHRLWNPRVTQRASLVVAAMAGGPRQQTWGNFARTLSSALRIVEDDGAIAVCSDLRAKPGRSLKRLAGAVSLEGVHRKLQRDRTPDALPATQLVRALQRAKVYLLSRLDQDVVEELGLAYVATPQEIANLSTHHTSCIVLEDAQTAVPSVIPQLQP